MRILKNIPFSYLWILRKAISKDNKTVLDLGCGDGGLMNDLSEGENWEITGVEIYKKSLIKARKLGIYKELVLGDIGKIASRFSKSGKKFDVVFCSQVLEHLPRKDGEKIVSFADKLWKNRIIFSTPRGFMEQIEESLGDNPYQVHASGWIERDFIKRGYKVRGLGFAPIWSPSGWARGKNKSLVLFSRFISFILAPLVYFLPFLGSGLLAYKVNVNGEKKKQSSGF